MLPRLGTVMLTAGAAALLFGVVLLIRSFELYGASLTGFGILLAIAGFYRYGYGG